MLPQIEPHRAMRMLVTRRTRRVHFSPSGTAGPALPTHLLPWVALLCICAVGSSLAGGMAAIPGGSFVMGGDSGDDDERPARRVSIRAFKLDTREVTYAEYDACVRKGRCSKAHYDDGRCLIASPPGFRRVTVPRQYRSSDRPVVCVTWLQARTYCRSRGKRLPTEAEWEYAARAMGNGTYAWGNSQPTASRCTPPQHRSPRAVGSHAPNRWGLYDMTGNVWEWTNDWYRRDYYRSGENDNPRGAPVGQYRVIRGGGWYASRANLRVRNRQVFSPSSAEVSIGFRCAQ